MGYEAVEDVGEFKKGDKVPDELGAQWYSMYKFPPVKLTGADADSQEKKPEPPVKPPFEQGSKAWVDDYLKRSERSVLKALRKDEGEFSADELKALREYEANAKNRHKVMEALKPKAPQPEPVEEAPKEEEPEQESE